MKYLFGVHPTRYIKKQTENFMSSVRFELLENSVQKDEKKFEKLL